jgi:hypothetical protein
MSKPKFCYLNKGNSILKNLFFKNWKYNDRSVLRNPNTNYVMELDIVCLEKKCNRI